ncbi:hypothetical protein BC831DRAFT_472199 [Entophlyctis helioformis]|nr:hypothetical protein BC831DRAFT_472199 [Entophlyctis helioformis]
MAEPAEPAELPPADVLVERLREVEGLLAARERELSLAAEIGQQLLTANNALQTAYEELSATHQQHLVQAQQSFQAFQAHQAHHASQHTPARSRSVRRQKSSPAVRSSANATATATPTATPTTTTTTTTTATPTNGLVSIPHIHLSMPADALAAPAALSEPRRMSLSSSSSSSSTTLSDAALVAADLSLPPQPPTTTTTGTTAAAAAAAAAQSPDLIASSSPPTASSPSSSSNPPESSHASSAPASSALPSSPAEHATPTPTPRHLMRTRPGAAPGLAPAASPPAATPTKRSLSRIRAANAAATSAGQDLVYVASLEKANQDLKQQLAASSQKLHDRDAAHLRRVAQLEHELSLMHDSLLLAQQESEAARDERRLALRMQRETRMMQASLGDTETEVIGSLQAEKQSLEAELVQARSQLSTIETRLKQVMADASSMRSELDRLADLESENRQLRADCREKDALQEQLLEQLEELRVELQLLREARDLHGLDSPLQDYESLSNASRASPTPPQSLHHKLVAASAGGLRSLSPSPTSQLNDSASGSHGDDYGSGDHNDTPVHRPTIYHRTAGALPGAIRPRPQSLRAALAAPHTLADSTAPAGQSSSQADLGLGSGASAFGKPAPRSSSSSSSSASRPTQPRRVIVRKPSKRHSIASSLKSLSLQDEMDSAFIVPPASASASAAPAPAPAGSWSVDFAPAAEAHGTPVGQRLSFSGSGGHGRSATDPSRPTSIGAVQPIPATALYQPHMRSQSMAPVQSVTHSQWLPHLPSLQSSQSVPASLGSFGASSMTQPAAASSSGRKRQYGETDTFASEDSGSMSDLEDADNDDDDDMDEYYTPARISSPAQVMHDGLAHAFAGGKYWHYPGSPIGLAAASATASAGLMGSHPSSLFAGRMASGSGPASSSASTAADPISPTLFASRMAAYTSPAAAAAAAPSSSTFAIDMDVDHGRATATGATSDYIKGGSLIHRRAELAEVFRRTVESPASNPGSMILGALVGGWLRFIERIVGRPLSVVVGGAGSEAMSAEGYWQETMDRMV